MTITFRFPFVSGLLLSCVLWAGPVAAAADKKDGSHWSLQPLVKPAVPGPDANPIDAFIKAKLAEQGLNPSPEADALTVIRRLHYALTGLPPSPEEADAFAKEWVADSGAAVEKLTTRLLASPGYGERWARHWMDTIHFADSHGYEHDIGRDNAWRFRDYLIQALNSDTAYPRFIREQLAADYFYPDQPELTPALGFLGAGLFDMSAFATTEAMFDYIDRDDLVTQTMAAFTSTTANCARCHAHKFDPISQEDYYSLQAVFSGILKGDVSYDESAAVMRERKRWLALQDAAAKRDATVIFSEENAALVQTWMAKAADAVQWEPLKTRTFLSSGGSTLTRGADGVFVSGGARPDVDTYTVTGETVLTEVTAVRLKVHDHDTLPMRGPGRQDNGNLHLSEFEVQVFLPGATTPRTVKVKRATADFNQAGWGIERAIDGDTRTAWGIFPAVGRAHQAVFELEEKLVLPPGAHLAIAIRQLHGTGHLIGAFSLALTGHETPQADVLPSDVETALTVKAADRTPEQRTAIAAYAIQLAASEGLAKLPPQVKVFAAAPSVEILSGDPVRTPKSLPVPKKVHLLHRGDFDKPRAEIAPGALEALTHLPARFELANPDNEASRRAALADWLAHPDNVLTWRSIVNRVWHYHFGRGICDTPGDFGRMGGVPTHPELLDWLAVWFRDDAKGSLKALHHLIVTSRTYRQSSQQAASGSAADDTFYSNANAADAANSLLWRQNRHRLDADGFRDFTIAVSGKLDPAMGGPAIQHFKQSKGPQNTPALDYTAYDWNSPGAGRRSIYRYVWRGIADPLMEAMDFPDLGLLAPTRGFSASSLQALALYNNNFILQHSEAFAQRVAKEAPSLPDQVARASRLAWLREPSAEEAAGFTAYAQSYGLAALCRLLLNSNEFLFVD